MTKRSLDEQIADAFAKPMSAMDLGELLDHTKAEAERVTAEHDQAERVALDPATRPSAVDEARKAMGDLTFRASRLSNAVHGLTKLLAEARGRESAEQNEKDFFAARIRRNEVVERIQAEFPEIAGRMLDLIGDILKNNVEVSAANDRRPEGVEPLEKAEAVVSGVKRGGGGLYPGRIVEMMIPNLSDPFHPHWPPRWRADDDERPLESVIDQIAATAGFPSARNVKK